MTALWHGRFVEADGVLTAYRQWGSRGSPIVLVGGFLEPSFVWDEVGPLLAAAGHRVYALDLDGFGYSERRGPWTLAEWADQAQGFMRALDIRDPLVVGHSLGAAVAVELGPPAKRLAGRARRRRRAAHAAGRRGFVGRCPLAPAARHERASPLDRLGLAGERDPRRRLRAPPPAARRARSSRSWTDQFRADGAGHAITALVGNGVQGFSRAQLAGAAHRRDGRLGKQRRDRPA